MVINVHVFSPKTRLVLRLLRIIVLSKESYLKILKVFLVKPFCNNFSLQPIFSMFQLSVICKFNLHNLILSFRLECLYHRFPKKARFKVLNFFLPLLFLERKRTFWKNISIKQLLPHFFCIQVPLLSGSQVRRVSVLHTFGMVMIFLPCHIGTCLTGSRYIYYILISIHKCSLTGVKKNVFFFKCTSIHPSPTYRSGDLQVYQRKASVQSLYLAGHFLNDQ